MSVYLEDSQCILLFGGMHSVESDFEIDGYVFDVRRKGFAPIKDPNGLSKLAYGNECVHVKGHIFMGSCSLEGVPTILHGCLTSEKELVFEEVKGL